MWLWSEELSCDRGCHPLQLGVGPSSRLLRCWGGAWGAGHCYELGPRLSPPRGLQLVLGTRQQPHLVDTIVMANLGYFQLKANPGR